MMIRSFISSVSRHRRSIAGSSPYLAYLQTRPLTTSKHDDGSPPSPSSRIAPSGASSDDSAVKALFSEENTKNLMPHEIAKLRLMYGLIREHVEASRRGLQEVDPESNPLLDPRSFDVRRLPRIPDAILKHFRHELPADVAEESSPVGTRAVWDVGEDGEPADIVTESANEAVNWGRVDERTMTPALLSKRPRGVRQAAQTVRPSPGGPQLGLPAQAKTQRVVLRHPDGVRVSVDFRAVALLKAFLSETGKIVHRRKSNLSAKSQRRLSKAVKTARIMALLHPEPKTSLTFEQMRQIEREMQQAEM